MSQESGNGNHSVPHQDEQSNGRREQNYLPSSDRRRYSDSQEYIDENNDVESGRQSNGPEDQ